MNEINIKSLAIPALILILVVLAFLILQPILIAIIFGLILGYIFHPIYKKLFKHIKEKNISALIIILGVIFLFLIPIWFLIPLIVKQIFDVYLFLQNVNIAELLRDLIPGSLSSQSSADFIIAINSFVNKSTNVILSSFSDFILNLPDIALNLAVTLFVFFFSLRDGTKLKEYIKDISPFNKSMDERLSDQFKGMTQAIIYGFVITGLIQGLLTGLGLFIFGVPQTLILTALAIFFSILPFVGAWLIWIPASLYLIFTGNIGLGIGLFLYGAILISWIDNIIRPYLVSKRTKVHSAVIFVGIIGGLIFFGVVGIILGPLILSYMLILIEAYKNRTKQKN